MSYAEYNTNTLADYTRRTAHNWWWFNNTDGAKAPRRVISIILTKNFKSLPAVPSFYKKITFRSHHDYAQKLKRKLHYYIYYSTYYIGGITPNHTICLRARHASYTTPAVVHEYPNTQHSMSLFDVPDKIHRNTTFTTPGRRASCCQHRLHRHCLLRRFLGGPRKPHRTWKGLAARAGLRPPW